MAGTQESRVVGSPSDVASGFTVKFTYEFDANRIKE